MFGRTVWTLLNPALVTCMSLTRMPTDSGRNFSNRHTSTAVIRVYEVAQFNSNRLEGPTRLSALHTAFSVMAGLVHTSGWHMQCTLLLIHSRDGQFAIFGYRGNLFSGPPLNQVCCNQMAASTSQWWRRLVNAYEVKAGMVCLQCNNCAIHAWSLQRRASHNGALCKYIFLSFVFSCCADFASFK